MVAAVKGSDLNPDFSFDFGADAAQAPWEKIYVDLAVCRDGRASYAFKGIKFGR